MDTVGAGYPVRLQIGQNCVDGKHMGVGSVPRQTPASHV